MAPLQEGTMLPRMLHCPSCGYGHDATSAISEETAIPKEGDVTICAECGFFSKFMGATGDDLHLIPCTAEETAEILANDREVAVAVMLIQSRKGDHS